MPLYDGGCTASTISVHILDTESMSAIFDSKSTKSHEKSIKLKVFSSLKGKAWILQRQSVRISHAMQL